MRYLAAVIAVFMLTLNSGSAESISELKSIGKAFTKVAKKSSPMVVFIQTEGKSNHSRSRWGHPFFPPQERENRQLGQGSGFVISSSGHIVTNNHVIAGANKVSVTFLDGKKVSAEILGRDEHTDIALLKVDLKDLPYMTFADSKKVEVGEWVIALGNPFGLSHSLTAGIVSALGRNSVGIANYENFIQTDAAINPGNSGGPLINLDGKAVGMNTAIFSRSGGYMGIGFAIPANMVKDIIAQLMDKGSVERGFLGVSIRDIDSEMALEKGMNSGTGVYIGEVGHNTPAHIAGIKTGDIVVGLNGQLIKNAATFRNLIAGLAPETKNKIQIIRDGSKKDFTVKLGVLPKQISQIDSNYQSRPFFGR